MLLITGAKIYPVRGPILDPGMILIDDHGKIKAIDEKIDVPQALKVERPGKVILPGLIDVHTHVGIWGDGEGQAGYDGNEIYNPTTSKVRAIDGVNPQQRSFAGAREGGITTVQILPGSGNPIGGLGFACKTVGTIIDEMVIKNPTGLKGALGENPKRLYGRELKKAPSTRMGTAGLIREYFQKATDYLEKQKQAKTTEAPFEIDLDLEPGALVLKGQIPFRIHAHRHDDIVTAIRLSEEFGICYSIEHCTDGHLIAQYLGSKGVIAHIGPGLSSRGKLETANFTDKNPAILAEHGVKVALMTDHPFLNCRYFLTYGAVAYKHGLSFQNTLQAMTINPAESLGIADRVGTLEPKKDADFIVLSGEPFRYTSVIEETYIDGKLAWVRPTL